MEVGKMKGWKYYITVWIDGRWIDSGEGPWETREAAETFAGAEVGVPYCVNLQEFAISYPRLRRTEVGR
jgi:hypothetical protein